MEKQKNIPRLRFPGFEGEWERSKLGEVCKMQAGKFINASDIFDEERENMFPCYGGNGVRGFTLSFNQNGKYSIIGRQGAHCGNVTLVNGQFYATEHALVVNLSLGFDTDWIFYLLYNSNLNQYATGLAQPGLSVQNLEKVEVKIAPSLPEQQKIAAFLTAVDEKLQGLQQQKALLEQYKKGVMQRLFSQELRFKDEEGKDFPAWEEKFGNELFDSISDKNHNSDLPILAISQEHGAIPRDMIDYQISVTDKSVESYKVVQKGDFIISLRSFQGGIEYSEYLGICSPAYIILRNKVEINSIFYKYYLKTDGYIQQLNSKLEGIRDGKMISYKYFSDIPLPYPSFPEQTRIATYLTALDAKIAAVQAQVDGMGAWKKGLLQAMFV
ncbi:MAG: restriction endonuclease subunit S [Bacteroidetes bacterium]|nr:restriction endonuclease subunit S [Bacteroidota bacterium]